jgi:hypothetical protein
MLVIDYLGNNVSHKKNILCWQINYYLLLSIKFYFIELKFTDIIKSK